MRRTHCRKRAGKNRKSVLPQRRRLLPPLESPTRKGSSLQPAQWLHRPHQRRSCWRSRQFLGKMLTSIGRTIKSCWQFESHALRRSTATNCRYPEACRPGHCRGYLLIDSQCARQQQHQTSTSMAEHGAASLALAVFPRSPRQGQLGIPKADVHSYSTYLD